MRLLAPFLLVVCFMGPGPRARAQPPAAVTTALDSALHLMQTHSLYAKPLNWQRIADSVHYKARRAQTLAAAFPALVYAFDQLRDSHGLIAVSEATYRHPAPGPAPQLSAGSKHEYLKGLRICTAQLAPAVGYLKVPAMLGTQPKVMNQWAQALRDSLHRVLQRQPAALVLDLRLNNGGNIAPMLTGLSPLLGDGPQAYLLNSAGQPADTLLLRNGTFVAGPGAAQLPVQPSLPGRVHAALPVAVLIGPATGSSGEILALILHDRLRARSFGEATSHNCNSTAGFLFSQKEGYLLLTTNLVADAHQRSNTAQQVRPDVLVSSAHDDFERLPADPTVQAALQWLTRAMKHR